MEIIFLPSVYLQQFHSAIYGNPLVKANIFNPFTVPLIADINQALLPPNPDICSASTVPAKLELRRELGICPGAVQSGKITDFVTRAYNYFHLYTFLLFLIFGYGTVVSDAASTDLIPNRYPRPCQWH
jgi:hypothetical protein